jgi:hypothetical protein
MSDPWVKPTGGVPRTPCHLQSEKSWDSGGDSTHLWHRYMTPQFFLIIEDFIQKIQKEESYSSWL